MARIRMKRQSNIGIRKKVIAYCLAGIMSVSLLAVPSVKRELPVESSTKQNVV